MRVLAAWAIAAVAGLALVPACGGGGGEPTPPPAQETPTPEVTPEIEEEEALDRSHVSFVDNLLAKEEAGECTRGEGLVATLKLFAGELDADSVLRHPDLLQRESTGVYKMAHEYLEAGPDAEAKAEISRLLDLLVFSNDRLEAMAGPATMAGDPSRLAFLGVQGPVEDCKTFFDDDVPEGVSQCLEFESVTIDGKRYRVFHPAPSLPEAGWTADDYALALEAIEETVPVYNNLGKMPAVNLVFSVAEGGDAWAAAWTPVDEPCGVAVYTGMRELSDGDFSQVIAHELAHCFQQETFPEQNQVEYEIVEWREEGLADYLSNVAYPTNNHEWDKLALLEAAELRTTLLERSYDNFIWFQHLANTIGHEGLFALIEALPESGDLGDQEAALANARPDIGDTYQEFAQALTDQDIEDTGGGNIPYSAPSYPVRISGPQTPLIQREIKPFGVLRSRIQMVEEEEQALLAYTGVGLVVEAARPAGGTFWSLVPTELPSSDEECGGIILVVTTTEPAAGFVLDVTDVRDSPYVACDSCLFGAWVMDNDDWAEMLSADPLYEWTVTGTLMAVFGEDGQVAWSFSDFTQTSVGEPEGPEPGEQTASTTNGGGSQSYSTRDRELLTFSGPEIHVTFTETGVPEVLDNYLDTALGDVQTTFPYECEGDRLIMVVTGLYTGDVEIEWRRVR